MSLGQDIEDIVNTLGSKWNEAGPAIRERLAKGISKADYDFLVQKIREVPSNNGSRIPAIRDARARFCVGLKAGKMLIDEVVGGALMTVENPPILMQDAIAANVEQMAAICRKSIKMTSECTDDRIPSALLGILTQLQELWVTLITKK